MFLHWADAADSKPRIAESDDPAVTEALAQGARLVGDRWQWFQDYGFLYSKWTVQCPANRRCQVGMGIKMGGDPLGEKIRFSGACEFVTVGIGSIHVRVADGKGPCPVILKQGSYGLVPIFRNKKF